MLTASVSRFAAALTLLALLDVPDTASAQNNSLYYRDLPVNGQPAAMLESGSWTFIPVPPPKEIRQHDIITIRVDELSRMQSEGESERRKNVLYDAVLKDWITLNGLKSIKPSPQSDGDPRVQGTVNQLYRAEGELETRESLTFNIAAEVADIRPNGNLVLEARKQIQINNEAWEVSLSGICRRQDIGPDNVVLSRDILDLQIHKRERGHVRDGYRRGWFTRIFDRFNPF